MAKAIAGLPDFFQSVRPVSHDPWGAASHGDSRPVQTSKAERLGQYVPLGKTAAP